MLFTEGNIPVGSKAGGSVGHYQNKIKWVSRNKSSLLLKIDLQNTQTLQLN
jgi:hypothetical protein